MQTQFSGSVFVYAREWTSRDLRKRAGRPDWHLSPAEYQKLPPAVDVFLYPRSVDGLVDEANFTRWLRRHHIPHRVVAKPIRGLNAILEKAHQLKRGKTGLQQDEISLAAAKQAMQAAISRGEIKPAYLSLEISEST